MFCIGLVGFLSRRNMIIMFLSVEMMLQAAGLSFVALSRYHNQWSGQVFVIISLTVAACEAAIFLGLVMMLYHRSGTLDIAFWQSSREADIPPYVDQEVPEPDVEPSKKYPSLTPAGVEPEPSEDQDIYQETNV